MKFKLIIKNENGEPMEEKIYKSINQIAKDLDSTYCSCQSNYLYNVGERKKAPRKRSQLIFDKKYNIVDA